MGARQALLAVRERERVLALQLCGRSRALASCGDRERGVARGELEAVRTWLTGKAMSIYGGLFEIQNNIIAKNILGLPENTQRG